MMATITFQTNALLCFALFELENKAKPERVIGDLVQLLFIYFICRLELRQMVSGYVL